ncbi:hypothetical protein [Flavobacterium tibetense]|uniref:tRNA (Guanine-N1)-methyltransferase n=1 Tax=Flavobacterium tibetense TaxID=2233533 RepID=A0A365P5L2_9FLAO|nr:hypothetical protein [Flavobacterium tibetense]RBA29908.1 hypothetical protein DPN68_01395 [Flavobacterium tibetense]
MKQTYLKPNWLLLLFVMISTMISAQNDEVVKEYLFSGKKIENKFNTMLDKATVFQEYKLVKSEVLDDFRLSFSSFLDKSNENFGTLNSKLEEKDVAISNLNSEVISLKNENLNLNNSVATISVFGINLEKGTYNFLMWSILMLFGFVAFYFAYRFKLANEITKNSKIILAEVEDEYQLFKQKSIEREQKLRRQLQDEIIKCRELKDVS